MLQQASRGRCTVVRRSAGVVRSSFHVCGFLNLHPELLAEGLQVEKASVAPSFLFALRKIPQQHEWAPLEGVTISCPIIMLPGIIHDDCHVHMLKFSIHVFFTTGALSKKES